ncbi:hypothetical protein BDV29DRAFT_194421 [Aspergillus leporis]|uniref:Zn(2)-C6 fungal-type domain-containing protein n=1 Tax=Aspergillus leporis TaxID=41062 RepID=A0A5N5WS13_9EURO|nr:hypothetical protein BDV29DRAFT_194421 [Aspergillus leporis]
MFNPFPLTLVRPRLRRTPNVYIACRQSKIKCSGNEPCANCQRRSLECRFVEGSTKITVTESYLQGLQRHSRAQQQSLPGSKRSTDAAFRAEVEEEPSAFQTVDNARSNWTSPFTLPSRTIKNIHKNKRSWTPSSVWSFTTRLSLIMAGKLGQFLLVLAFGNAFLLQSRNVRDPPGSKFFVRAMSHSLLASEALAVAGLYLYSIDHRETAHIYVNLSHLLSSIPTSIYKPEKTELGTFLEKTRSILQTTAGHAQEIENIMHSKFQNSVDTMPKGAHHITLLYHQHGEEDWENFLAPTKSLISTGIKSAPKTLQILADGDSPLEFTYAAAIHLAMVNAPFPHVAEGQTYSEEADSILDEMIYKGNRLAAGRKAELTYLEILFRELAARIERRGLKTLTLSNPAQEKPESCPNEEQRCSVSTAGDSTSSPFVDLQTASNLEFLDNIGTSYEFLTIVDQMGNPENYSMLDPADTWRTW